MNKVGRLHRRRADGQPGLRSEQFEHDQVQAEQDAAVEEPHYRRPGSIFMIGGGAAENVHFLKVRRLRAEREAAGEPAARPDQPRLRAVELLPRLRHRP